MPTTSKYLTRAQCLEKALKAENRKYGCYDDSQGTRYIIGPLYLLAGETKEALRFFRWYGKIFSDDIGDPVLFLCWALALLRDGKHEQAVKRLVQAMFSNLYLIPHLLKKEQALLDIWHGSNVAEPSWLEYIPAEYYNTWTEDELKWAEEQYYGNKLTGVRNRYIEIYHLLKTVPTGPKRSDLLREARELENSI